MKKTNTLFTILIAISSFTLIAQNPADFENLNLSPESYWDGSDQLGQHNNGLFNSTFNSGDFAFSNTYDTTYGAIYGYWSKGWAYSNITDTVTSGYVNLFSAKASGGAFNTANYAIGKNNSTVVFNQPQGFTAMITNSTYAANIMRDGDVNMIAKKFTNADQDYFKVTVFGYSSGNIIDSTTFLLADFTHVDSTNDYIVNDWQYIGMPNNFFDSVQFKLASSDVDPVFGMNTPAFFCLDNLGPLPLSVEGFNTNDFSVYPNPAADVIYFGNNSSSSNYSITIFDSFGRIVLANSLNPTSLDVSHLPSGLYVARIRNNEGELFKKVIKK
jgi:hypothetical protein